MRFLLLGHTERNIGAIDSMIAALYARQNSILVALCAFGRSSAKAPPEHLRNNCPKMFGTSLLRHARFAAKLV
jgi:hypothetical protein